jgi:hypothetical protein
LAWVLALALGREVDGADGPGWQPPVYLETPGENKGMERGLFEVNQIKQKRTMPFKSS